MQYVIIGAGPAGVVAAEALRRHDPEGAVTILGDEPEPPYSRMAIPYLLADRIGEQGTYLRKEEGHFERLGIEVRGERVAGLDTAGRRVRLESGAEIGYDRLLIASGARPLPAPVPGGDLPGVHPCWTLADARAIAARARPGASVVLMGAGFIGSIILECLAARGVRLTVVEIEDRMVPRMMNEQMGGMLKSWCEDKGVTVRTSTRVEGIEAEGDGLRVQLEGGETIAAALVISATGVTPNVEFLAGSGVAVDRGVVVDEHLATSAEGVYAAGDVAQGKDFSTGGFSVQAIQPTAVDHARIAASNMAGLEQRHPGSVAMNVLDTLGLISSSFGLWNGVEGGDGTELSSPERYRYINLQFADDVLVGASTLGLIEHIGVVRGLIQSRVRLKGWKTRLMRDPTRLMEAYLASTQNIPASPMAP